MHPKAAILAGVVSGEPARVISARGSFVARVVTTEEIEEETVFAPFHWDDLWSEHGSVNETTHDATCPTSKQPELKGAAVRVEPAFYRRGRVIEEARR